MQTRYPLMLLGVAMIAGAGAKLSMQLGLSSFGVVLLATFAMGIVLLAREPARQLSERVRALEAQHAKTSGTAMEGNGASAV